MSPPAAPPLCVPSGIHATEDNLSLQHDWIETPRVPVSPSPDVSLEKLRAIRGGPRRDARHHQHAARQLEPSAATLQQLPHARRFRMATLAPAVPTMVALKAPPGRRQQDPALAARRGAAQRHEALEGARAERPRRSRARRADDHADVQEAMDRALALDAAYPLPLLPGMLEKFSKVVEPARWWPSRRSAQPKKSKSSGRHGTAVVASGNGWSQDLENNMRGILRVIKAKDENEFLTVGKLVVNVNRDLAVTGPALAGTTALASVFIGSGEAGRWASGAADLDGALVAVVNMVEHGGQMAGMLFELLRADLPNSIIKSWVVITN